MKIISKSGKEYFCYWKEWGWSYARPSINIKKKFLFFEYEKEVWDHWKTGTYTSSIMEKMRKSSMVQLFQESVDAYEDYLEDWND